ncbi:ABC transporter permease subunit [Priestia megaterium]
MSELILPAPLLFFYSFGGYKEWIFHASYYADYGRGITRPIIWRYIWISGCDSYGRNSNHKEAFFPYVIASQAVPKLALAPLFILWFGFGMTSKVVITALICFFLYLRIRLQLSSIPISKNKNCFVC